MQVKSWSAGIVVAFGVLFGLSTGASALVVAATGAVPSSPLDSSDFVSFGRTVNGSGTAFDEFWEFQYGSGSVKVTLENDNGSSIPAPAWETDITNLTLKAYADADGAIDGSVDYTLGSELGSLMLGPVQNGVTDLVVNGDEILTFFAALFTPGNFYAFRVEGETSGTQRGVYNVQVEVVPLPPAIWLFISALVSLVSFARIRRGGAPA